MLCCTRVASCFTSVTSCFTLVTLVLCRVVLVLCCVISCCVFTCLVFYSRSSVVTLSMELCYKSSLTADSTRNIKILHIRCIMPYIKQLQIPVVCRILLSKRFSPQQSPSLLFLYTYPKHRDKKFFKGFKNSF